MEGRRLKMNIIREAVVAIGRVLGTILGQDFVTPVTGVLVTEVLKKYPDLPYSR
jgi:hypothetical protein